MSAVRVYALRIECHEWIERREGKREGEGHLMNNVNQWSMEQVDDCHQLYCMVATLHLLQ